jgi:hypothetical protein
MAQVERRSRLIHAPCTMTLEEMQDVVQQVLEENELSIEPESPRTKSGPEYLPESHPRSVRIRLTNGQEIFMEAPFKFFAQDYQTSYYAAEESVYNQGSSSSTVFVVDPTELRNFLRIINQCMCSTG